MTDSATSSLVGTRSTLHRPYWSPQPVFGISIDLKPAFSIDDVIRHVLAFGLS